MVAAAAAVDRKRGGGTFPANSATEGQQDSQEKGSCCQEPRRYQCDKAKTIANVAILRLIITIKLFTVFPLSQILLNEIFSVSG
jgi:hypothetical protein